jgi:ABC-type phosphate transport system substrate-binding protein
MRADRLKSLRVAAAIAVAAMLGLLTFGPAGAAQAATYVPIEGGGSSYAFPALNQWAINLEPDGLNIDYEASSSAQGRFQYLQKVKDFAGSDIAFITSADPDPFAGTDGNSSDIAYSYIPDVAGGLAFIYNLTVDGHKITNMRLSGQTLMDIFTGKITNWNDPLITKDYGEQLPSIPITVVTRSDGAGENYFLTNWMNTVYHKQWVQFCVAQGGPPGCGTGPTELFPGQSAGFKALAGADVVSSYVAASSNNGAIGYVEDAYALEYNLPTVNMENAAGYDVGPTAGNVAIALEDAKIDENQNDVTFLMQNLDKVYTDPDPRTYPLSSYSYLIVPRTSRTVDGHTVYPLPFSDAKGITLSTYVNYILCGAQQEAGDLGYSPLPKPMVEGGLLQEKYIPGAVGSEAQHNYNTCNNPAFHDGVDEVIKDAPMPNKCQKASAPLNCNPNAPGNGATDDTNNNTNGTNGKNNGANGTNGTNGTNNGTNGTNGTNGDSVNPNTGQVGPGGGTSSANSDVYAQPVGLASRPAEQWVFGVLTALELIAVVTVPVLLGLWLQRVRRGRRAAPDPGGGPPPPPPTRPALSRGER